MNDDRLEEDPLSLLESYRTRQKNTPTSTQKLFQESARLFGTKRYGVEIFNDYSLKIRNRNQFKPRVITEVGKLYTFRYRPMGAASLPYFDMNPLIFLLDVPSKKEIVGMNFHYLSPSHRLMAYYSMFPLLTDKTLGENARFRIDYELIKSQRKFVRQMTCIRTYKTEKIRSMVYEIDPKYWESSIVMPTQRFIKRRENVVYTEVNRRIRKILGDQ